MRLLVLSCIALLHGCGGGGGSSSTLPVVSQPAPVSSPVNPITNGTYAAATTNSGASYWRDRGYDGTGVTIAYLDGGVSDATKFNHLGLQANQQYVYNSTLNLYVKDANTSTFNYYHGQDMIETGVGTVNGMAPGASVISGVICDTTGSALDGSIMMGAQWAIANNAKIVNVSFSYGGFSAPDITATGLTQVYAQLQNTFNQVQAHNTLVVNSAGNSTQSVSTIANTQINPGFVDMAKSGVKQNIIIAGALDPYTGYRAYYSNFAGTDPDIQSRFLLAPGYGTLSDGSVIFGTSPAASNISAAASLLMQRWPTLGGKEVSAILLQTANRTYAGYDVTKDGMGKLDMVAAFSPVGVTGVTVSSITNKLPVQSFAMTLPSGTQLTSQVKTSVYDSYNRDFAIPVATFFSTEKDTSYSQYFDYLNGFEYVEKQNNNTEKVAINGKVESLIKLNDHASVILGQGGKFSESTLSGIALLNDKNVFDDISMKNRYYYGFSYKDTLVKHVISGSEYEGYASSVSIEHNLDKNFFVTGASTQGKLTQTLSGQALDAEIGFKGNGFALKAYRNQTNYKDTMLTSDYRSNKTGYLAVKTFDVGLFSDSDKLAISFKNETTDGGMSFMTTGAVDPVSGLVSTEFVPVSYSSERQNIGLSFKSGNIKLLGLIDVKSPYPNNGAMLNYSKLF